jgi:manganese/zinc/iron transport system permease protein
MIFDWSIDGWIVLAGALCAGAASLLGNFLLLRRLSLMGDAISHSVLPGIAAGFLFTGQRSSFAMLVGAGLMGLFTVWLIEMIRKHGRVEESAAIGVVFTSLFAIGLGMIVRAGNRIDLDPSCVLYGNLETITIAKVDTPFGEIPHVVLTLVGVCLLNALSIGLFYKQWQISTFDPLLSQAQGVEPGLFHYLLAALVAITCIASFEAVGNILVVAMLVVPAATSFLLCKRLSTMIWVSCCIGAAAAFTGHLIAISVPKAFGFRSVNSAAMMAVMCGAFLVVAMLVSPKSGILFRWLSNGKIARKILGEDVLAFMYRRSEKSPGVARLSVQDLVRQIKRPTKKIQKVLIELIKSGWLRLDPSGVELTADGFKTAQNLVRAHRLWEQYLSVEMHVSDARLHAQAESLEHFTDQSMRGQLDVQVGQVSQDPHGRNIPPESH